MGLSSIAPHLRLLTPSHRLNPNRRLLPIPPSRFSKPRRISIQVASAANSSRLPLDLSQPSVPARNLPFAARSSAGEAAGHPADEKADSSAADGEGPLSQMRWLGLLVVLFGGLWCFVTFPKKMLSVVLASANAYTMCILFVSIGIVVVSFFTEEGLSSVMLLGEEEEFVKEVKVERRHISYLHEEVESLHEEIESWERKNRELAHQIKQVEAQNRQYRDWYNKNVLQALQGTSAAADQGREGCGESKVDDAASSYDPTSGQWQN